MYKYNWCRALSATVIVLALLSYPIFWFSFLLHGDLHSLQHNATIIWVFASIFHFFIAGILFHVGWLNLYPAPKYLPSIQRQPHLIEIVDSAGKRWTSNMFCLFLFGIIFHVCADEYMSSTIKLQEALYWKERMFTPRTWDSFDIDSYMFIDTVNLSPQLLWDCTITKQSQRDYEKKVSRTNWKTVTEYTFTYLIPISSKNISSCDSFKYSLGYQRVVTGDSTFIHARSLGISISQWWFVKPCGNCWPYSSINSSLSSLWTPTKSMDSLQRDYRYTQTVTFWICGSSFVIFYGMWCMALWYGCCFLDFVEQYDKEVKNK